jgi:hypothetical protein
MEQSPSWEANTHSARQEIPRLYGTRRFITVFTKARHRSLTRTRCIQSTTFHPISLRSTLILSCHLHIKIDLKTKQVINRIHQSQDRDQWRAPVNWLVIYSVSQSVGQDVFEQNYHMGFIDYPDTYTRVYPKVSGLAAWSENCNWYSSLPLGAIVSLFCESVLWVLPP